MVVRRWGQVTISLIKKNRLDEEFAIENGDYSDFIVDYNEFMVDYSGFTHELSTKIYQ